MTNLCHSDSALKRAPGRQRTRGAIQRLESRMLLAGDPVISEFVASNRESLDDGNGRSSDWIEIFNRGDDVADLTGWYLTDDLQNTTRWRFPNLQIEPGGYLIVFASGNNTIDQDGFAHTNFKLSSRGESLALVDPDAVVAQQFKFPKQFTDVSFGFSIPDLQHTGYMSPATPGFPNGDLHDGVTEATVASNKESAVFTETFAVDLTTSTVDGTIVFTLDGSLPNESSAVFADPIEISQSTQIRARVMEPNRVLGPTLTSSYSKLSAEVMGYSSELPVMVIDNYGAGDIPNTGWNQTNTGIRQLPRQAANLMLFEADEAGARLDATADLSSRIGIRVRGAFSLELR